MNLRNGFISKSQREAGDRNPAVKPSPRIVISQSPFLLLAMIASAIFLSEALLTLLLTAILPKSLWPSWFIDALLLTIVLVPILYYAVFRPPVLHITERKRAEDVFRKEIKNVLG